VQTESGEIPTTGVYALDRALLEEVPEVVKERIPDLVRKIEQGEQGGAGQPATRSDSDPEGGDKPQPESGERSR